jgi:hypothetical protein
MDSERKEFLFKMYDQMFNDINRHILVVWQSISVIVGAFAIFALVEKNIISLDIASSIITLLTTWSIAHIIDASYWYNRNLVIIANIERQFLNQVDTKEIHFYFSDHRKKNKMISHLKIQLFLSVGLSGLVCLYHFSTRVFPGLTVQWENFELERSLPYFILLMSIVFLHHIAVGKDNRYKEFLEKSPGKEVQTVAEGAVGHGQ